MTTKCIGDTFNFVVDAATGISYLWEIDGATILSGGINDSSIALTWATAGNKTVKITVTKNGCSETNTEIVKVENCGNCSGAISTGLTTVDPCPEGNENGELTPLTVGASGDCSAANVVINWHANTGGSGSIPSGSTIELRPHMSVSVDISGIGGDIYINGVDTGFDYAVGTRFTFTYVDPNCGDCATTPRTYIVQNRTCLIDPCAGVTCTGCCTCVNGVCVDNNNQCTSGNCEDCVCQAACTDTCASLGYSCGSHTICGQIVDCGTCPSGQTCNGNGQCVSNCTDTCASLGWTCGTVCGENCGACSGCADCVNGTCVDNNDKCNGCDDCVNSVCVGNDDNCTGCCGCVSSNCVDRDSNCNSSGNVIEECQNCNCVRVCNSGSVTLTSDTANCELNVSWSGIQGCDSYQVRLIQGGSTVATQAIALGTTNTTFSGVSDGNYVAVVDCCFGSDCLNNCGSASAQVAHTCASPVSYNCGASGCVDPGDGSGTYASLAACQAACVSYNCGASGCESVTGNNGTYATQQACQTACVSYNCDNNSGNCNQVTGNSGTYVTQQDCEANCTCGEVAISPSVIEELTCVDDIPYFELVVSQGLTCIGCCSDYSFVADIELIDNVVPSNSTVITGRTFTCQEDAYSWAGGSLCEFGTGTRTLRMYNIRNVQYSNSNCEVIGNHAELTATVTITQADLDNCCN